MAKIVVPKIKKPMSVYWADPEWREERQKTMEKNAEKNIEKSRRAKAVIQVSTGKLFASLSIAARAIGVSRNAIWLCVTGYGAKRVHTVKGSAWRYATDEEKHAFAEGRL